MTILEKEGEEVVDLLRLERKGARDAARRRNIMASLLVPAAWKEASNHSPFLWMRSEITNSIGPSPDELGRVEIEI